MFDPFEILGIEKKFTIDLKDLEKRYFEAQRQCHPDQFNGASSDKKAEVLKKSTQVNQAYLLLKDPLQRALFLLKDNKMEPLDHDPETLGLVIQWKERHEGGEDIASELEQMQEKLFIDLEDGFEKEDFEKVCLALYRQTYVQKLLKEMKKAKAEAVK